MKVAILAAFLFYRYISELGFKQTRCVSVKPYRSIETFTTIPFNVILINISFTVFQNNCRTVVSFKFTLGLINEICSYMRNWSMMGEGNSDNHYINNFIFIVNHTGKELPKT
ncbi:hypothetical protein [Paenibacillus taichungensis]|uniref:hypothetical protein n=1 Tax=Paenibacillus taichungensis TaxID=484184 RepID=UPI0035E15D73